MPNVVSLSKEQMLDLIETSVRDNGKAVRRSPVIGMYKFDARVDVGVGRLDGPTVIEESHLHARAERTACSRLFTVI